MGHVIFSNDEQRNKAVKQCKWTLGCPRCEVTHLWRPGDMVQVIHEPGCLNEEYNASYTFDMSYSGHYVAKLVGRDAL